MTPAVVAETPVTLREPVVVMTGRFEDASAACNEWSTADAVAIRSVPARTGDYACKLCATGSGLSLLRTRDLEAGRYRLRAWVRGRSDLSVAHEAALSLGTSTSTPVSVTNEWTALETTLDVDDAASVTAKVVSTAEKSECFLVDDVVLEKL